MKLSIIIPTFNSGAVINRALDSIISQTFSDWEVLIMDGVSTDNTIEVAQSYNDPRIRIFSETDKGIYDAMNKGIKKAKGEWLYFLGSDDFLLSPKIFEKILCPKNNYYDVIYGDVQSPILPEVHRGQWSINNLTANRCHQAIFYKRELFSRLGVYNLKYHYLADFEFNLRWFLSKYVNSKYVPIEIAFFSPNGVSEQHQDGKFWNDFHYIVVKNGYNKLDTANKIFYLSKSYEKETNYFRRLRLNLLMKHNVYKTKLKRIFRKNFHS